ncbi:hypothetical protein l11_20460 [Neisseria weaveri LMG 5135]|nr:hypothetical protein l11_20460 [Neisseria weaveri LMG 5135]
MQNNRQKYFWTNSLFIIPDFSDLPTKIYIFCTKNQNHG